MESGLGTRVELLQLHISHLLHFSLFTDTKTATPSQAWPVKNTSDWTSPENTTKGKRGVLPGARLFWLNPTCAIMCYCGQRDHAHSAKLLCIN